MFSRFDAINACDRRTDRRTELPEHIRAIAYMLSRVKGRSNTHTHVRNSIQEVLAIVKATIAVVSGVFRNLKRGYICVLHVMLTFFQIVL